MKIKFKVRKLIRFGGWYLSPDENMECELPQLISGPSAVRDLLKRYPDVIEVEGTEEPKDEVPEPTKTESEGQVEDSGEVPEGTETEPETPVEEPKDEVPEIPETETETNEGPVEDKEPEGEKSDEPEVPEIEGEE